MTQTEPDDIETADLEGYARDLITLRRHARVIARYLAECGVPRGETTQCLMSLVRAGIVDAYDDLALGK